MTDDERQTFEDTMELADRLMEYGFDQSQVAEMLSHLSVQDPEDTLFCALTRGEFVLVCVSMRVFKDTFDNPMSDYLVGALGQKLASLVHTQKPEEDDD